MRDYITTRHLLSIALFALINTPLLAQFGSTVTISGPKTVCRNAVQTYTAIGNASNYSWNVTAGGTIVQGRNSQTVQVRWTSTTGGGSLTLSYTSTSGGSGDFIKRIDDRYHDFDDHGPMVKHLHTAPLSEDIDFTGILVTITPPSVGGTLSGHTENTCEISNIGTITLSGHAGTVQYWQKKTFLSSDWETIANTTTTQPYSLTSPRVEQYRAYIKNGQCSGAYSTIATVAMNRQTQAGTISGSAQAYEIHSGTLQLTGHLGTITSWQKSQDGGKNWTSLPGTSNQPSLQYTNVMTTTHYRTIIQNANCQTKYTTPAVVTIYDVPGVALNGQPATGNEAMTYGTRIELSCTNSQHAYQWRKSNANIPGATNPTYQVEAPGTYQLWVKKTSTGPEYTTGNIVIKDAIKDQNENYVEVLQFQKAGINDQTSLYHLSSEDLTHTVEYYDGLGRPIQSISVGASPDKTDILTPITYDAYGRQLIQYLPYASDNTQGAYVPTALTDQQTFYDNHYGGNAGAYAHSTTHYEPSPLNRVDKQYGPGQAWSPDGADKSVRYDYQVNTTGEVRLWTIAQDQPATHAYYPEGQLYKNITTDEEGHQVIEFVDKQQRTVLKRVQAVEHLSVAYTPSEWADTYYLYDDFGNLRFVLPPEAIANLSQYRN